MKKLLALLLALSIVGAVSAQVGGYFHGTVTIVDQDMKGKFAANDWGDTLTFKASKDNMAFSATFANPLQGLWAFTQATTGTYAVSKDYLRDFTASYTLFDKMAKVSVGKLRNGTYRMGSVDGNFYTDRISGFGLLIDVMPMTGLSVGVNLPFSTTAMDMVDVLKKADLGLAYTIDGLGKIIAMANLDLVANSNVINAGFSLSAVENLSAIAVAKITAATTTTTAFNVGAAYTMDALTAGAEFEGTLATAFTFVVRGFADYTVNDNLTAGADVSYGTALDISAYGEYAFGGGLSAKVTAGYADAVYYSVTCSYEVSF